MPRIAPGIVIVIGSVLSSLVGCGSPSAELIEGDLRDCLVRGQATGAEHIGHAKFTALLAEYVDEDGLVDYAGLRASRRDLDAYLAEVAAAPLCDLPRDEQYALLLNAYNAYTLATILDANPGLRSIRDLDDPWGAKVHGVGGFTVSLDEIEHRVLRPLFKDPRVHFAVNCASIGCPPLRRAAFEADTVDAQLSAAVRDCFTRDRYLRVEDGRVLVTRLLDWYGEDFAAHPGGVAGFLREYAPEAVRERIPANGDRSVGFLDYDWSLNRQPGR